jgi:hypothetical protein
MTLVDQIIQIANEFPEDKARQLIEQALALDKLKWSRKAQQKMAARTTNQANRTT